MSYRDFLINLHISYKKYLLKNKTTIVATFLDPSICVVKTQKMATFLDPSIWEVKTQKMATYLDTSIYVASNTKSGYFFGP